MKYTFISALDGIGFSQLEVKAKTFANLPVRLRILKLPTYLEHPGQLYSRRRSRRENQNPFQ
jgi:hypothetical protein